MFFLRLFLPFFFLLETINFINNMNIKTIIKDNKKNIKLLKKEMNFALEQKQWSYFYYMKGQIKSLNKVNSKLNKLLI